MSRSRVLAKCRKCRKRPPMKGWAICDRCLSNRRPTLANKAKFLAAVPWNPPHRVPPELFGRLEK